MKKVTDVIVKVASLPVDLHEVQNSSFYELLRDTGYFEMCNSVSESEIANVLLGNLELVEKWFEWSENKRTSDGWYLLKNKNGNYEVGRIYKNGTKEVSLEFCDKISACAAYIKREIDEMREY